MFKKLGEEVFDDYWMNYGKISVKGRDGKLKKISNLKEYMLYRGLDERLINARRKKGKKKALLSR